MPRTPTSLAAEYRRTHQEYSLDYNGGGSEHVIGSAALAKRLHLKELSMTVYLSKGKGTFVVHATNPITGEPDLLYVTRLPKPVPPSYAPPKPKSTKRLGRPPKPNLEPDGAFVKVRRRYHRR